MQEFRAIVSGRVQMVMFRDFTCRKARKVGVNGQVRNLQDGTVEVIAQGSKENLERLIAYLHKGSILSNVENVAIEWCAPQKHFDSFELVY
jgi:acylphosphatase